VARAVESGAKIIAGGGRPDMKKGWFLNPALVGGLDNDAKLAREEIFGPVSVVLTYRTVEEAIKIANDSALGLKAYLFGAKDQCLKLVPELYVGTIQISGRCPATGRADDGYKHSGVALNGARTVCASSCICPHRLSAELKHGDVAPARGGREARLPGVFAASRARPSAACTTIHPPRHA
jgi:acyl-CoA reductase-like NAD-dependent aldehyde dehydrogenase